MVLNEDRPDWQTLLAMRERLIGRTLTIRNGLRCEIVTIKDVKDFDDKIVFTVEMTVRRGRGTASEEYDIAVEKTATTLPKFSVGHIAFTFRYGEAHIDC